jgi:hypothetical protein
MICHSREKKILNFVWTGLVSMYKYELFVKHGGFKNPFILGQYVNILLQLLILVRNV